MSVTVSAAPACTVPALQAQSTLAAKDGAVPALPMQSALPRQAATCVPQNECGSMYDAAAGTSEEKQLKRGTLYHPADTHMPTKTGRFTLGL